MTGGCQKSGMKESIAAVRADLGGYRVEFAPGVTQGSQYVDLIAIDRWGRLVGWSAEASLQAAPASRRHHAPADLSTLSHRG